MAKVLIIDDDDIFRDFIGAVLERNGHEVITVGSARHVVHGLRKHLMRSSFDIVIVDMLMPEVNGIEVIRTFKESYHGEKILAVTGGSGRSGGAATRLELAMHFGAEATLVKPFSTAELCRTVAETLGFGASSDSRRAAAC